MDNTIINQFSTEFEAELPSTRKCIERIPEKLFDWKPHEKSMTLDLSKPFVLKNGDQIIISSPLIENISSTLNHWVHHRGQLTVYMRLNDILVPSIYGPSADDKNF